MDNRLTKVLIHSEKSQVIPTTLYLSSLIELRNYISCLLSIENSFKLKYKDAEGDLVTVTNEEELQDIKFLEVIELYLSCVKPCERTDMSKTDPKSLILSVLISNLLPELSRIDDIEAFTIELLKVLPVREHGNRKTLVQDIYNSLSQKGIKLSDTFVKKISHELNLEEDFVLVHDDSDEFEHIPKMNEDKVIENVIKQEEKKVTEPVRCPPDFLEPHFDEQGLPVQNMRKTKWETQLQKLRDMGFKDREKATEALECYEGNIDSVVAYLCQFV